jgi:hypothetical protein
MDPPQTPRQSKNSGQRLSPYSMPLNEPRPSEVDPLGLPPYPGFSTAKLYVGTTNRQQSMPPPPPRQTAIFDKNDLRFQQIRRNSRYRNEQKDIYDQYVRRLSSSNNPRDALVLRNLLSKRPLADESILNSLSHNRRSAESQTQRGRIDNARKIVEHAASKKRRLEVLQSFKKSNSHGGKVMIYTGPKNGKYIIKNGSKVYIDRKSLTNNFQYKKKAKPKR